MKHGWSVASRLALLIAVIVVALPWSGSMAQNTDTPSFEATPVVVEDGVDTENPVDENGAEETSDRDAEAADPDVEIDSTPDASTSTLSTEAEPTLLAVPANEAVQFYDIWLNSSADTLLVDFELIDAATVPEDGSSISFTYPASTLVLDESPITIFMEGTDQSGNWREFDIAVA